MSDLGGFSLHELFRGEAEMHAAALSEGLVRLEGTSDAAAVEPLMRAAHSIKGAARVIGLDIAVRMAHAMEDVLVAMQKGREPIVPARIDQLLRGSDLLGSLARIDEQAVASWTAAHERIVDELVAALREAPSQAPAPAPAPSVPQAPATAAVIPAEQPAADARDAHEARTAAPDAAAVRADQPPAVAPVPSATRVSSVRVTAEKLDRLLSIPVVSSVVRKRVLVGLGLDQCQVAAGGAVPRWRGVSPLDAGTAAPSAVPAAGTGRRPKGRKERRPEAELLLARVVARVVAGVLPVVFPRALLGVASAALRLRGEDDAGRCC